MKKSINRWLILCFAGILALTLLVAVGWNYHSTWQAILDREESDAYNCAVILSGIIDHYSLDALVNQQNERYKWLTHATQGICRSFGLEMITIATVSPEAHEHANILIITPDSTLDHTSPGFESLGSIVSDSQQAMETAALGDSDTVTRQVARNRLLWYVPYQNQTTGVSDPVVICMVSNPHMEFGLIMRDFLMDILLPAAALILGFLLLVLLVRRRIISPIKKVSDSMKRFARNSRTKPEPLNICSRDEIGEIAESFEKMTEDIIAYTEGIEELTREQVQTHMQLEVARRIQNGLVPEQFTREGSGYRIHALTRPARAVGGDFYDCFPQGENSVCVFIGDVSGKGISAAIFMAMAKTIIREKLLFGLSPAEALTQANEELCAQNPEGLFATVFAAVLNPQTGVLRYANAGHTLPVLLAEKPEYLHPSSGMALGLFEDAEFTDESLQLSGGEGILLYTDGVTEAVNPQHAFFGTDRLLNAVQAPSAEEGSEDDPVIRVSHAVGQFCDGREPFDDMAVLVLRRSDDSMSALPVDLSSFDKIKKIVFRTAGNTPDTRRALLVCDELLSNIVAYSGAKTLAFSCRKLGAELQLTFTDDGIPYDPTAVKAEEKTFDELDEGGMGLNIIRRSASSMRYERKDDRNKLYLSFRTES